MAVGLLLFACSELALWGVAPSDAAGDTSSHLDTTSGYAAWAFVILAPPATAVAELLQQGGIGLFDPPPGPLPGEDFVPPAPTSEESGVVVLITPTDVVVVNRPLLASPRPSRTPSQTPTPTVETATPTATASDPAIPPGDTTLPTQRPTATNTPVPTLTLTPVPTRTRPPTESPTLTPTVEPSPTARTDLEIHGQVRQAHGEGPGDVTVSLSNGASTSTGPEGYYGFLGLSSGVYEVWPSAAGCEFWPSSRTVTLSDSNAVDIDFFMRCIGPPTATDVPPTPTDTEPPPTATEPPPTNTEPPTDTAVPPTATDPPPAESPTATATVWLPLPASAPTATPSKPFQSRYEWGKAC